jgi:hypothetical protein
MTSPCQPRREHWRFDERSGFRARTVRRYAKSRTWSTMAVAAQKRWLGGKFCQGRQPPKAGAAGPPLQGLLPSHTRPPRSTAGNINSAGCLKTGPRYSCRIGRVRCASGKSRQGSLASIYPTDGPDDLHLVGRDRFGRINIRASLRATMRDFLPSPSNWLSQCLNSKRYTLTTTDAESHHAPLETVPSHGVN